MRHRWDFFKESDSSFGLFYPLHYVVAGFDTLERAHDAELAFLAAGFAEEDVAIASGPYMINHVESQAGASWLDHIKATVADFIGTEAGYIEDDLKLARRGGAFMFVYSPDHDTRNEVHAMLKRLHPIFARRYQGAGVERLVYPPQSTL